MLSFGRAIGDGGAGPRRTRARARNVRRRLRERSSSSSLEGQRGCSRTAAAPVDAPAAVRAAIAAGNLIHTLPYPTPDVHFGTLARLWPAYDCSGALSFVLYGAGLLGPDALDSTGPESYCVPGPGRWIMIYANAAHTWIVVAGIAFNTAEYGCPAIPPGTGRPDAIANLADRTKYVVRHPAGL